MSIESLILSCIIDALEMRKVITVDITGAFMQSDIDELVHVKFEGIMAEMLVKINPELNNRYAVMEQVQLVLYAALDKALYGTIHAYLLFWHKLTTKLIEWGYKPTPTTGASPIKSSREVNVQYCGMLMNSKYHTCHRMCWKRRLV